MWYEVEIEATVKFTEWVYADDVDEAIERLYDQIPQEGPVKVREVVGAAKRIPKFMQADLVYTDTNEILREQPYSPEACDEAYEAMEDA